MSDWIKLKEKAATLPPGHYGIGEAERACEQEYRLCKEGVKAWMKRPAFKGKGSLTLEQALKLVSNLLYAFGEDRKVKIILNSKDVSRFAGAHYNPLKRAIHFPSTWISVSTLIHEFAHYLKCENRVAGTSHGKEFCELQDMAFEAAEGIIKGW